MSEKKRESKHFKCNEYICICKRIVNNKFPQYNYSFLNALNFLRKPQRVLYDTVMKSCLCAMAVAYCNDFFYFSSVAYKKNCVLVVNFQAFNSNLLYAFI